MRKKASFFYFSIRHGTSHTVLAMVVQCNHQRSPMNESFVFIRFFFHFTNLLSVYKTGFSTIFRLISPEIQYKYSQSKGFTLFFELASFSRS